MSRWLIERHQRLQNRLRSEMQGSPNNEAPAAGGADRSQTARANRVRELRQETSSGSAAVGADFSVDEIPPALLLRFKKIPDTDGGLCPAFESMTEEQQDFMGENMGLPIEKWRTLVKTPVLALPQTKVCKHWMDWACATGQLPYGAGCMLMNPNQYENDIWLGLRVVGHHGPHTTAQQDVHILAHGYPMTVWQWIVAPDPDGDRLDDGFELVQDTESTCDYPPVGN
jgi:hypothetical protein